MKEKNRKKILIFGSGRWARIYINYLKLYANQIYIFTSNSSFLKNSYVENINKNILIVNDEKKLKGIFFDKVIIANNTNSHLNSLRIISKINMKHKPCLIEKPFYHNLNYYNIKKYFTKNNYLSLQYSYSSYFFYLSKLIKSHQIFSIKLFWYDKKNEKKNYNKDMFFIEDVYYHFFSILRFFIKLKFLDLKKVSDLHISKKNLNFKTDKIKIELHLKKRDKFKKRILQIRTAQGLYKINFLRLDVVKIYLKNKSIKKFTKNLSLIKTQIYYFLFLSSKIKINSLINLRVLFKNLLLIRKNFS